MALDMHSGAAASDLEDLFVDAMQRVNAALDSGQAAAILDRWVAATVAYA